MTNVRRHTLALAVAFVLGFIVSPPALAGSSSALYYETETHARTLAIEKLNLTGAPTKTQVVGVGHANIFGIAVAGPYIFWTVQAGPQDRGMVMRATLTGRHVERFVGGLTAPASLVFVNGFLYWADQNAIGRVAINGSHLTRRLIVLPRETGGGVADGLASDSNHLFFTRCIDHEIGRAALNGSHVDPQFVAPGPRSCPQGVTVSGGHLYWTELGSGTIGRARLNGRGIDGRWLNVHTDQGPFQIVADTSHIYWTWGGVAGSPAYTGRANINGSKLDRRFLFDSVYPLALSLAAAAI